MPLNDNDEIRPEALMKNIAKSRLIPSFGISFAVHIILLILFSIPFLGECFKYGTVHPKVAIEAELRAQREKEAEEEVKNRLKRAEEAAKDEKPAPQANSDEAKMKEIADKAKAEGKEVPEIIKTLNETSDERPGGSNVSLDGDLL